jgi:2-keto-4-pentenoate hydratase
VDRNAIEQAAERITRARVSGTRVVLPDGLRPADPLEGYAVQEAVAARMTAGGWGERAGWKIGCTTLKMQNLLGIGQPGAGGVYATTVFHEHATFRHQDFQRPGVECEIAVLLERDLPGPTDRETAAAAVAAVCAAIEIVDDRYGDFQAVGAPTMLADDFFNAGCVLGPWVRDFRGLDLGALEGRMIVNGEPVARGHGRELLGHPFEALAWLAGTLAASGRSLRAGEHVLLGSVTPPWWAEEGDAIEVAFDRLGSVRAALL